MSSVNSKIVLTEHGLSAIATQPWPQIAIKYFVPIYDERIDTSIHAYNTAYTSAMPLSASITSADTKDTVYGEVIYNRSNSYALTNDGVITCAAGSAIIGNSVINVNQDSALSRNSFNASPLSNVISGSFSAYEVGTNTMYFNDAPIAINSAFAYSKLSAVDRSQLFNSVSFSPIQTPSSAVGFDVVNGLFKFELRNDVGNYRFNKIAFFVQVLDHLGNIDPNYEPTLFGQVVFDRSQVITTDNSGSQIFTINLQLAFTQKSSTQITTNNDNWTKTPTSASNRLQPGVFWAGDVAIGGAVGVNAWQPYARLQITDDTNGPQIRLSHQSPLSGIDFTYIDTSTSGMLSLKATEYSNGVGIALGNNAIAIPVQDLNGIAFAFGNDSKAIGDNSFALGRGAYTNSLWNSFAIGFQSIIDIGSNEGAHVFGWMSSATGNGNRMLAIGNYNLSRGDAASTFGNNNSASNLYAIAIGNYNNIASDWSYGFGGYNIISNATYSVAIGRYNEISDLQDSYVFGFKNKVYTDSPSTINYSVLVGLNNSAARNSTFAFGSSNLTSAAFSVAAGFDNKVFGDHSFAIGDGNEINPGTTQAYAFGSGNNVSGTNGYAFGLSNNTAGFAFGYANIVIYADHVAIGNGNTTYDANASYSSSIAYTFGESNSGGGFSVGSRNYTTGHQSPNMIRDYTGMAFGNHNTSVDGFAFGSFNNISNFNTFAFGYYNYNTGGLSFGQSNSGTGVTFGKANDTTSDTHAFGYANKNTGSSQSFGARNANGGGYSFGTDNTNNQPSNSKTNSESYSFGHANSNQILNGTSTSGCFAFGSNNSNNVTDNGYSSYSFGESNSGNDGFTVGKNNTSIQQYSYAIGFANTANSTWFGAYAFAIGYANSAIGQFSFAIGSLGYNSAQNSFTFGLRNSAIGNNSTLIGENNYITQSYCYSLGFANSATGANSYVVGQHNTVNGLSMYAFGLGNIISNIDPTSGYSYAIGFANTVNANSSQAYGHSNTLAQGYSAMFAFGDNNNLAGYNSFSFGRNNSNLNTLGVYGNNSFTFGESNIVHAQYSYGIGYQNNISGAASYSYAIGRSNSINISNAYTFGFSNSANTNELAFAIGNGNLAQGYNSYAIGIINTIGIGGQDSFAFGYNNNIQTPQAYAFGQANSLTSINTFAIGNANLATESGSMSLGFNVHTHNPGITIGYNIDNSAITAQTICIMNYIREDVIHPSNATSANDIIRYPKTIAVIGGNTTDRLGNNSSNNDFRVVNASWVSGGWPTSPVYGLDGGTVLYVTSMMDVGTHTLRTGYIYLNNQNLVWQDATDVINAG